MWERTFYECVTVNIVLPIPAQMDLDLPSIYSQLATNLKSNGNVVSSQIGAILPAVETLVHVDGAGVVPTKGDLLVASGRHVCGRDRRGSTPAHNAQRILSNGTGGTASGRYLEVRTIVPILGLTTGIVPPATNVALFGGDAANVVVKASTDLAKLGTVGWTGLSLVIIAPAHRRAISMKTARVGLSGRYLNKGTGTASGRVRLRVVVRTPAQDVATDGLDATDVISTATELNEGLVVGRRGDVAPARHGTGGSHGATVGGTGGDLLKDAGGSVGLALLIVTEAANRATAGDSTSTGQGAGEVMPCAYGGFVVRTGGWTFIYRKAPSNRLIDKAAPASTAGISSGGIVSLSGRCTSIASLVLINPAASTPRTNGAGLSGAAEKAKQQGDEKGRA